jgi:6-phosphogluconolactonase
MAPEVIVDKPEALARIFARCASTLADRALRERGRFALALPGGSVATVFLPVLGQASLDWNRADFFWTDERSVPPDHPDSNYGLARSLWLENASLAAARTPAARVPAERVHPMPGDAADLESAAGQYEATLRAVLGSPARLDLTLLGVGEDGHVGSLFPGHPLLAEEDRLVAPVFDAPKPPPRRLTLTLPALATSRLVVAAAFGPAKAPALAEALRDPRSHLPLALVLRRANASLVLLDPAAAGSAM